MKPRSNLQHQKLQEAAHEAAITGVLKKHKAMPVQSGPTVQSAASRMRRHISMQGKTFDTMSIPALSSFNRSLKTKDGGRIRLAVANHFFSRYSVPRHLQEVWWKYDPDAAVSTAAERRWNRNLVPVLWEHERLLRERWFICVARGGSLYKEYAKSFMTKKEVHAFLTCPLDVTFEEAILYALAASHTDDVGIRTRILKSKLITKPIFYVEETDDLKAVGDAHKSQFWRDVLRFFCVNPVSISEMNDLIDYITSQYELPRRWRNDVEQPEWSIKGRTLHAIREATKQWHRDLGRVKRMGARSWDGVDVNDALYENEMFAGVRTDWSFTQIKTSKMLADEGNKMHHCVYSYQGHCVSGRTSIWSLKRKRTDTLSDFERAITLEINNTSGDITQIRGYANRLARPDEMAIIRKWAAENGMRVLRH